jgi:glycogen debranching enzyme
MAEQQPLSPRQPYTILSAEVVVAERTLVLKQGDTFGVFNEFGDIDAGSRHEEGLYHSGTRFLSQLTLTLDSHRPLLLSSTVRRDNVLMTVDMTNPDLYAAGELALPRGTLHVNRAKLLWQSGCYERIRVRNYAAHKVSIDLFIRLAADYVDIFEVRGERRPARGQLLPVSLEPAGLQLAYRGLDRDVRRTRVECSPAPTTVAPQELRWRLQLGGGEEQILDVTAACQLNDDAVPLIAHEEALQRAEATHSLPANQHCGIDTSNDQFNAWLRRSAADLAMMMTDTGDGPYPYAGVPWFDTTFGRDGIITALETLWMWPAVSRGVLAFLAHTQATEFSAERDAEPGKILHEARRGEMAALGEIPFGRYYGSVDATPLFIVLAGAYLQRTDDLQFIRSIWAEVRAALAWIEEYGDADHDGFVEYRRRSPSGLIQQGWKDSHDSVFHADGRLAEGPIALCEVQGYVYQARQAVATIATALGNTQLAAQQVAAAERLRERFEAQFWCEELGSYALALDGAKQPCLVLTSNPGHCLYAGIASEERARAVISLFGEPQFFSGWGVRTVAETERRYNPMSYHNGSVWPHDNALLAAGAARYQGKALAARILGGQFEASTYFDLQRMPELFCGFGRRHGAAPTRYPVACSPQSWAAGATFMLIQAALGLSVNAVRRQVLLSQPVLPAAVQSIRVRELMIGDASVDFTVQQIGNSVGVSVERRHGAINVLVQT